MSVREEILEFFQNSEPGWYAVGWVADDIRRNREFTYSKLIRLSEEKKVSRRPFLDGEKETTVYADVNTGEDKPVMVIKMVKQRIRIESTRPRAGVFEKADADEPLAAWLR
ncbi:MAG: hypothetical protein ACRDAM_13215 [Casimicrobium sp.]